MTGNEAALGAALIAGLLAGGHCLAMCGAIAGGLAHAVPAGPRRRWYPLLQGLGRVAGYAAIGVLAGLVGTGLGALAPAAPVHAAARILAAAALVLVGLRLLGIGFPAALERAGVLAWRRLAPLTRALLPVDTPLRAFAIGALWGWLPCGLSWGVALAAIGSGDGVDGALLMTAFGVGTLPATLGAAWGAGALARLAAVASLRRAGGVAIVLLALVAGAAPWLLPHDGHADHAAHAAHD
jgi:sulfite exporter TauE/SafE